MCIIEVTIELQPEYPVSHIIEPIHTVGINATQLVLLWLVIVHSRSRYHLLSVNCRNSKFYTHGHSSVLHINNGLSCGSYPRAGWAVTTPDGRYKMLVHTQYHLICACYRGSLYIPLRCTTVGAGSHDTDLCGIDEHLSIASEGCLQEFHTTCTCLFPIII